MDKTDVNEQVHKISSNCENGRIRSSPIWFRATKDKSVFISEFETDPMGLNNTLVYENDYIDTGFPNAEFSNDKDETKVWY